MTETNTLTLATALDMIVGEISKIRLLGLKKEFDELAGKRLVVVRGNT